MKRKLWKRVLAITATVIMTVALAGCGSSSGTTSSSSSSGSGDSSSTASSGTKSASDVKVALILPGSANDKGWNQEAYDGLKKIEALGCKIAYSENVAASDYETTFRGYADQGFTIIIGHGTEFEDPIKTVAPDYPNTMFCVTSSDFYQEPNVCSLQNLNNEQGFMAGVVAASASKTHKVAAIGGMEIPSIQSYILGFQQGVAYVNNGTVALTAYTGDFNDATKVKEQASAYIDQGADIISQDADEAGLGLFEAIKDAPEGVYAIGSTKDQYEEAPGRVLTSALNQIGDGMCEAVKESLTTPLEAKCYKFGIKEGVIGLADYHDCSNVLTDEQKAYVKDTMAKIASGEIQVKSAQQ